MKVHGASLVYLKNTESNDWQHDMRVIVRPLTAIVGFVAVEMHNESGHDTDIQNDNIFSIECSALEAREIAEALLTAARVAEGKGD